ncbi:MAG TPA: YchJ family metal-binding protein [Nannocystis sp.]|jgi:SEC-C motif-containing protein
MRPCPCGLPGAFEACCGRYISGARRPDTAEQLMRSRYTAYVKGAVDYLIETTAAASRGVIDRPGLIAYCRTLRGVSLKIVETVDGGPLDERGVVAFEATLRAAGTKLVQRERSRFVVEDGRWVYVDGEVA